MSHFETHFHTKLSGAMRTVSTILETTKHPRFPSDVSHQYDDKFSLADLLTNTLIASQINCLEYLNVDNSALSKMLEWAKHRTVTLRFSFHESCVFLKEAIRKEESPTLVTETDGIFGKGTKTKKVVTKFTDYVWKYSLKYELFAFKGNDTKTKVIYDFSQYSSY